MNILWHTTRGLIGWHRKYSHYLIGKLIHGKLIVLFYLFIVNRLFWIFFQLQRRSTQLIRCQMDTYLSEHWCSFWSSDKLSFYLYFFKILVVRVIFFLLSVFSKRKLLRLCVFVPLRATLRHAELWNFFASASHQVPGQKFSISLLVFFLIQKCGFLQFFQFELTFLYFKLYIFIL